VVSLALVLGPPPTVGWVSEAEEAVVVVGGGTGAAPPPWWPAAAAAEAEPCVAADDGELPGSGGVLGAGAGLAPPLLPVTAAELKPVVLVVLLLMMRMLILVGIDSAGCWNSV